jgi:hypothetical protein
MLYTYFLILENWNHDQAEVVQDIISGMRDTKKTGAFGIISP